MRVVARARKPDGDMVRLSYRGGELAGDADSRAPRRAEDGGGAESAPALSWWDRWWLLGVLEQPGYQRLF